MTIQELQQLIISNIYENTSGDISGSVLQNILLQISNKFSDGLYFGGIVSDESSLTPDTNSFYICLNDGTYQSFGDVVVENSPKVQYLIYDNILENWNVEEFPIPTFDFVNIAESCLWGGVVTPNEEPIHGNDHRYFYLAFQEGRYTHFNNNYVDSQVCLFYWSEILSNWMMLALWENSEHLDELLSSKANKVNNATQGNLAGLDSEGNPTDSGISADDVATQQELAGKQDLIQDLSNIRSGAAAGATALQQSDITPIENAISIIESVIPAQASVQNQLADKNFVNSQVTTASANFVGTFETLAELQAVQNPTKNDYGFVIETDALGNQYYDRYKYNGTTWLFEYKVESTSFTSEQWAAIQSGITSAIVQKINDVIPSSASSSNKLATAFDISAKYTKPSTGIPKTDLASGVQTSLGKADTAVQQVTVGTTTTGNAGTNASVTNSGTSTAPVLDFTIPRGADGADGQDGADAVNPFKGWWPDLAALKAAHTATAGDSAYVKDAYPATTWSIYVYDATASSDNYWADSGTDADTSNVQTFASSQEVNEVHIVNDFTTGGADDVPSAETVKVIAETTMEFAEGLNILNPSAIISKRINYNGGESNISSYTSYYGCTDFIEIGDGVICNHSIKYSGIIWRGAAVYDINKLFIGTISVANNGDSLVITKDITSWNDTPAEGADTEHPYYVRFNLYNPASVEGGVPYDSVTDGYAVYRGTTLPSVFQPWFEPYWKQKDAVIQDNAVTTSKIADAAVTPSKSSFFKNVVVSDNILNPATIRVDKMPRKTDGVIINSDKAYCTDFIPIDEMGLYINHAFSTYGTYYCGCAYYGADKTTYIDFTSPTYQGDSLACNYIEGAAYVIFTIPNNNTIDTVYVCRGTQPLPNGYEPYVEQLCIDPDYILTKGLVSADEIVKAAGEAGIYSDDVEVVLPDKFYAVVGDTLQLFYQGMVIAPDFRNYDIYAKDTAIGKGYGRYFQATPNSAGTTNFILEVSNQNMRLLSSKTCQIVTVNPPSNPATNKNILCIGDSLTEGGKWVCELQRRLKASDGTPQGLGLTNITFVGSMTKTLYGQTSKFYGKSGWGWSDFCTQGRAAFRFHIVSPDDISKGNVYSNNGYTYTVAEINNIGEGTEIDDWTILCTTSSTSNTPQSSGTLTLTSGSGGNVAFTSAEADGANLLWDSTNNRINFKKYCTVNASMTDDENLDYLVLLLTWNQLPASEDIADWSEIIGYIEDMLDAIHIDYPTCKVKMMGIQFPYIDSFVATTNNQHTFATIRRNAFMNKLYQEICNREEYSDYVEFVNISAQFDSQYNMDLITSGGNTREKDVNTRNSHFKEMFVGNTVHPGTTGYMQIADAIYRVMCAALQ